MYLHIQISLFEKLGAVANHFRTLVVQFLLQIGDFSHNNQIKKQTQNENFDGQTGKFKNASTTNDYQNIFVCLF